MPKLIAIYAMTATVEVTIQNREDLVVTGNEAVPQPLRIVAVRVKSGQIEQSNDSRFPSPSMNSWMDMIVGSLYIWPGPIQPLNYVGVR